MGTNKKNPEEMYLFLDFNNKLSSDVFDREVYLKIVNLNTPSPLVQLNDCVYKGNFDYSIGTNLIFEENEDPLRTNVAFEKQTPISLKCTTAQTKVLSLKQMKVVPKKADIPEQFESVKLNFKLSYEEVLAKLENGALSFEDLVEKPKEQTTSTESTATTTTTEHHIHVDPPIEEERPKEEHILERKYRKLKELALRPTKRAPSPELVTECDRKYKENYEYHNLECQVLQPSDFFRETALEVDENTLENAVDIDRSLLYGIIASKAPNLTDEDKTRLLSMENFDNLSLVARYYVIKMQIEKLNDFIANTTQSKLTRTDKFGRSPIDTLETYQKLANALENKLHRDE